jgi:PPOX class probable F420-dependent enzyme
MTGAIPTPTLPADAAAFVTEARVARLGTVGLHGQPLVVPVCYAFDGRRWYSAIDGKPKRVGARALGRVRNIQRHPRVSVLIDRYDDDWRQLRYVIIQGSAALLAEGSEFAYAIDLLAAKYPQYATVPLGRVGDLVIRVTPDAYLHWSWAA